MSVSVVSRAELGLGGLQHAVERAGWRDLFALAAAMVLVGVSTALAGAYAVGFVAVCAPLAVIAFRSSAAACVLIALTSPVVALGSIDAGFHFIPVYAFVAAGVVGVLRRGEWREVRVGVADMVLVAFLGVAVVVTLANVGRVPASTVVSAVGANASEVRWLAQTTALFAMAGLYVVMRVGTRNEETLGAVLRALLVATAFVGGYALYQILGKQLGLPFTYVNERRSPGALPQGARYIRVNGTLTEASPLAQFCAVALCLGIAWVFAGVRRTPWLTRRTAVLAAVGGAGLVCATLSKSGLLACAIWLPLLVVMVLPVRRWWQVAVAALGGLALIGLIAILLSPSGAQITGVTSASERYVRVGYWLAGARIAREHPFGIGVGNYTFHFPIHASMGHQYEYNRQLSDAHNLFLEAIVETGALGGALFIAFVVALVARVLAAARRRRRPFLTPTAWGIVAAFMIGATMHLTYSYFYFPFEWVLAGLLSALPPLLVQADEGQ